MKPINILLILSLLLLGSCVDKDLNNDPTKSANLNPNFQLTGIELRQWGSMDIGSICNRYMSPLTQQMQGNWDATNYGGQYRNDDNQIKSLWNFMYQNQIKNIVDLVSRTDGDAGYANLNAIARIFKVYLFSILTDVYGDIPYFAAGTAYFSKDYYPKYDKQQDIYNDFSTTRRGRQSPQRRRRQCERRPDLQGRLSEMAPVRQLPASAFGLALGSGRRQYGPHAGGSGHKQRRRRDDQRRHRHVQLLFGHLRHRTRRVPPQRIGPDMAVGRQLALAVPVRDPFQLHVVRPRRIQRQHQLRGRQETRQQLEAGIRQIEQKDPRTFVISRLYYHDDPHAQKQPFKRIDLTDELYNKQVSGSGKTRYFVPVPKARMVRQLALADGVQQHDQGGLQ